MFSHLESSLTALAYEVPLEIFVFVASFLEEVIAPVPSASVLLTTGLLASVQGRELIELIPLILLAAAGKTLGAIGVYYLSRALGYQVVARFGRWFGVTNEKVAEFGERLNRSKQSFWLLVLVRALPIVPSSLISVGGGILKVDLKQFLLATLIGTVVRDSFFIYIGFVGVKAWQELALYSSDVESYVQLGALIIIIGLGVLAYRRRMSRQQSVGTTHPREGK